MTTSSREQCDARAVFGRRASHYTTSATHTDRSTLDQLLGMAEITPQQTWLDVGTGTGHTALALAEQVNHAIGSDVTSEMLDEAIELTSQRGVDNVSWHLADVQALPYREASFAGVTSRRAAHHFIDIDLALHEMRRVLAPGGWLLIDDRSAPEDVDVDEIMHQLDRLHDPSHVRQYRPSVWRELLSRAGFELQSLSAYTQHRPIASLTRGVAPADAQRIEQIVASVSEDARHLMNVEQRAGTTFLNHWYLMLAARKGV